MDMDWGEEAVLLHFKALTIALFGVPLPFWLLVDGCLRRLRARRRPSNLGQNEPKRPVQHSARAVSRTTYLMPELPAGVQPVHGDGSVCTCTDD